MNDTFFKSVHITNFKSLKDVTLSDCKRINLLIGKPNVGKSNILEAIGLFGLTYFGYEQNDSLNQFIRVEHLNELFFDGDKENDIFIETDIGDYCKLKHDNLSSNLFSNQRVTININEALNNINLEINKGLNIIKCDDFQEIHFSRIKHYKLNHSLSFKTRQPMKINFENETLPERNSRINSLIKTSRLSQLFYLTPPFGINLINVIQENRELKKELVKLFAEYKLRILFDKSSDSLRIMKETKDGEVLSLPYSSIADTLQRIIFFKTAIASNKDSIILFEEPEAHCFPPYIRHITQEIIESESNQFFIATHSPYVLNDFLEYKRDDVAIFIADFKNGQTVIKRLTDSEVNDVYGYGIDLFFNSELFTDEI